MALLVLSGLITNITGKLGGSYFSKKNGSPSVNRCGSKLTKADSGRSELQAAQQRLGAVARSWQALDAEQRLAWQTLASTLTFYNKANQPYTPSAYEVFMQRNVTRNLLGQSALSVPVANAATGLIASAGVGWNVGGALIFKYPPASPTSQCVVLYASAPQSPGTSYPRGGYKKVYSATSIVSGDTVIGSGYADVYGYEPTQGLIFFKIVFIDKESAECNGSKLTKADSGFL